MGNMESSNLNISKIKDARFGQCVKFDNGQMELWVTLDYGPRIAYFAKKGMENMMFVDEDKKPLGEPYDIYEGDQCILYGGHRLWCSPEWLPQCYHPDNLPVTYELQNNKGVFTAAIEAKNEIQKTMIVSMLENEVVVTHSVTNLSKTTKELAPWAITMMDAGGVAYLPQTTKKTGVLPNRHLVLWDYSNIHDERVQFDNEMILLKQNKNKPEAFKLGYNNERGFAAYANKNQLFVKRYSFDQNAVYPDGGCNCETYTNGFMMEMESLGGLVRLLSGETVTHIERWELLALKQSALEQNEEVLSLLKERE